MTVAVDNSDEWLLGALVDIDGDEFAIAPISDEPRWATEWDLLVDSVHLGYPAMIEVWNQGVVHVDQIVGQRALLDEITFACFTTLVDAVTGGDVPDGLPVGPTVRSEDDPRLLFQDREAERTAVFWGPAALLAGIESFGALVHARQEELEIEAGILVEAMESETDWHELLRDQLDIYNKVPAPALKTLMTQLSIPLYTSVGNLLRSVIVSTYGAEEVGRPALARRRRGSIVRGRRPPEKERLRLAEQYLKSLAEQFRRES